MNATPNGDRLSALHAQFADPAQRESLLANAPSAPDRIHQWLADLVLLSGVPFDYLVPDQTMLPPTSLRFFFIDENWVERLIDGALSVGGRTGLDDLITTSLSTTFRQPVADAVASTVRQKQLGVADEELEPEPLNWPLTGFVLRSVVADHWKGVVVENTSADNPNTSLSILRLDQPASGVVLGIFNGQLGSLTFKHPPETLHFGVTGQEHNPPTWTQELRSLDDGSVLDPKQTVPITFRNDDQQVLDVVAIADAMQSKLTPKPATFTSSEFAIQMIESPETVTFEMLYPAGS